MTWVVAAAVVLALGRYPYDLVRERRRFAVRSREGKALVPSYGAQCPKGVRAASWTQAVGVVQGAWRDVVSSPGNIDDADLDAILDQMRGLASRATPRYVRTAVAEALGQIGPPAAAALPGLTEALKDPDSQVRSAAEEAIKKIRAQP